MTFDLKLLGKKLLRYRNQFQLSLEELSRATGIEEQRLDSLEGGSSKPSGDEVLILSDFYKCDYRFFVSGEKVAAFEQTETLFRRYSSELTRNDRWAIQEFLYLAENEHYLRDILGVRKATPFHFVKRGRHFKTHGKEAAARLRDFLAFTEREVPRNVYDDFRKVGIYVFRRKLENSGISGLCVRHPSAGDCILVNYSEDVYRQRFTAAHEAAHAILDRDDDVIVSFRWRDGDLREIRANTFASHYLMPRSIVRAIPADVWKNEAKVVEWANKLMVSTEALAYALSEAGIVDDREKEAIKDYEVPAASKVDPEIPDTLTDKQKRRRRQLAMRGLAPHYVHLCVEAYERSLISAARLGEMLLVESEEDLLSVLAAFGGELRYGD